MENCQESKSCPKVIVKKIIHADQDKVFDAWTKPELMQHWFVGGKGTARVAVDLRVGGSYSNEMHIEGEATCSSAGSKDGAQIYAHHGQYLEITRPKRLVFTWNSPSVQNTKVTVDLRKVDEGTEVTITHELPTLEDCQGHEAGWTFALNGLAAYLG